MTCALLIGLEGYKDLGDLPSANADLRAISGICRERLHVREEDIDIIAGECDAHILKVKVEQFCRNHSNAASCVLYYSGHGGVSRESERGEGFSIYGSDDQPISLSTIMNRLEDVFPHGLVIVDSCYAGSTQAKEESLDFLTHDSQGFTVIASCGSQERSYSGSNGYPSVFTGQLKLSFDVVALERSAYFPISRVISAVCDRMGISNEREPLVAMHPVSINKYACDGVFSTDGNPDERGSTFEFDCEGLRFIVSSMNSRDYRRAQVSVLLCGTSEADLKEALRLFVSHDVVEKIKQHPVFENAREKQLICDKALANIVFEIFPDEVDMRRCNYKWRVYWIDYSIPHGELCSDPDFEVGSFKVERTVSYHGFRQFYEEHAVDTATMARELSDLYKKLRYLLESIGCAYDQVSTGVIGEEDFAVKCCQLDKLTSDVNNQACNLSYPRDSDDLESDANHLMGMSRPLVDITQTYASKMWKDLPVIKRQSRIKALLDICAESHAKLFAR